MPGRKKLHSALGYHLPSAEPRPRGDRASWYPWVCDGVLGKDVPTLKLPIAKHGKEARVSDEGEGKVSGLVREGR